MLIIFDRKELLRYALVFPVRLWLQDIGVQAVWRWDEEENLEDEPVPPKSPRRTPAISRKLRRYAA